MAVTLPEPGGESGDEAAGARLATNRDRQRELYGAPLGVRVRRLTALLGVSQARLARTLRVSPTMLSQLVTGRRVKIGDPAVLARLVLLDQRCRGLVGRPSPVAVDRLLAEVSRSSWRWVRWDPTDRRSAGYRAASPGRYATPADALRRIAEPARLAAAAAALGPTFPELAEVLRQAAGRPPARSRAHVD